MTVSTVLFLSFPPETPPPAWTRSLIVVRFGRHVRRLRNGTVCCSLHLFLWLFALVWLFQLDLANDAWKLQTNKQSTTKQATNKKKMKRTWADARVSGEGRTVRGSKASIQVRGEREQQTATRQPMNHKRIESTSTFNFGCFITNAFLLCLQFGRRLPCLCCATILNQRNTNWIKHNPLLLAKSNHKKQSRRCSVHSRPKVKGMSKGWLSKCCVSMREMTLSTSRSQLCEFACGMGMNGVGIKV